MVVWQGSNKNAFAFSCIFIDLAPQARVHFFWQVRIFFGFRRWALAGISWIFRREAPGNFFGGIFEDFTGESSISCILEYLFQDFRHGIPCIFLAFFDIRSGVHFL